MYTYRVKEIVRIIDGDTIDTKVDLGFGILATIRVRLYGVDTPEIFGAEANLQLGKAAAEFTREWLEQNQIGLTLKTYKGSASSTGVGDGAFGRWLGTFSNSLTHRTLTEALIEAGFTKS